MKMTIDGKILELVRGDITEQQLDAIVNAANSQLAGGGGVDGAIHRRGGPAIMEETRRRYPKGCPTGSAVISNAGNLPARFVIHAVGPVWDGGGHGEAEQLANAYRRCLELAGENLCQSIAFPAISCGVYGYPIDQAAEIAVRTIREFLQANEKPVLVRFVVFGSDTLLPFESELKKVAQQGE